MRFFALLVVIFVLAGCIEEPVYDVVPELFFNDVSTTEVEIGQDSLIIAVDFQDGDGDLGTADGDTAITAFLIDRRTNFTYTYQIPFVNGDSEKAISGTIWVTLEPFSISCRPDRPVQDTISYGVYIRDRAGHESNVVDTPPIILNCP